MKGDCANLISSRFLLGRGPEGGKKHSSGMAGAIIGIGISLIPIVLVLIVSNGMIQGITNRYMETKTYHIQVAVPSDLDELPSSVGEKALAALPGIQNVVLETDGTGIIARRPPRSQYSCVLSNLRILWTVELLNISRCWLAKPNLKGTKR